jgi:HEAT repeat protein
MPLFKKSKVSQLVKAKDVASLIETATGSDPPKVRADAVHEFPRFAREIEANHMEAARSALNQASQDANAEVRASALFAWAELRWSESVDRLLAGLEDGDWVVRVFAVTMLGRFDDDRIPARLTKALDDDSEGMVREAAASSLGELRDPSTVEALRRAANGDREREVRKAAEQALKSLS